MKKQKLTIIKQSLLILTVSLLVSCSQDAMEGRILVLEVPADAETGLSVWNVSEIDGARIVAVNPEKRGRGTNLTKNFLSAISPALSYDGKKMLFSAKKDAGDKWQIWEMKLSSGKAHQITSCDSDCLNPTYLPLGRLGFTKSLSNDKFSDCNMVFTANLDGSNIQQVSFSPQSFAALTTLNDGRFLALQKQVYPNEGIPKMMVMRPDGTKLELFYKAGEFGAVASQAIETDDKEILFAENNGGETEIVALSYNLPLHSRRVLTAGISGRFYSVANYREGELLVSYRKNNAENFGLFNFHTDSKSMEEMYKSDGYHILEAVLVQPHQRPRNLPSEVQLQENSGLLMCQDINFYGMKSLHDDAKRKASKIEILGIDTTLGVIDVEADGSFYLKVESDIPFRIQTLNAEDEVVNGPGSWYYIRPNERRACVGCHTGPEIAPFNRQPLAIKKAPAIITDEAEMLKTNSRDYEHE